MSESSEQARLRAAGERAFQRLRPWRRAGRPIWTARLERSGAVPEVVAYIHLEGALLALARMAIDAQERGERWRGELTCQLLDRGEPEDRLWRAGDKLPNAASDRFRRMLAAVLRLARREGVQSRDVVEHVVMKTRAVDDVENQATVKQRRKLAAKIRKVLGVGPETDIVEAQARVRCACGAPFEAHSYRVQARAIGVPVATRRRTWSRGRTPAVAVSCKCRRFRL